METFILNALPSIKESISLQHPEAPGNHVIDETDSDDEDLDCDSADEGFSFSISTVDNRNEASDLFADEIFRHGHIIPLYSFSDRTRLISMDDTDTDASPTQPETVREILNIPRTAPGSPIKSWSTGTTTTRRRNPIHEFLFRWRSHSDGKEKLGFFEKGGTGVINGEKKKKKKDHKEKGKRKDKSTDSKIPDNAKNDKKAIIMKPKEKDALTRRRSFLPYVGFFGGGPMHEFTKKFFF